MEIVILQLLGSNPVTSVSRTCAWEVAQQLAGCGKLDTPVVACRRLWMYDGLCGSYPAKPAATLLPTCRRSRQDPPIPVIGSFGYRSGMSRQPAQFLGYEGFHGRSV